MNERRNISSKGMKKKKVIIVSALLLLFLLSSIPHMEKNQIVEEMPVGPLYSQKISHGLAEQMALTEDDEVLSVIAVTTCDINQNVINNLQTRVGYFEVKRVFTVLPCFEILVTSAQIETLATLPMIQAFEWGDTPVELCMNDAQHYSNTDDLRLPGGYNVDGSGITVAVIDSGIWTGHGDLDDGQLIAFRDIVGDGAFDDFSDTPEGIDYVGHGTNMAGIIAGSGDGDPYLIGIAPGAELVGVRIANDNLTFVYSDAVDALNWVGIQADNYSIDIVSCSFSSLQNSYYYGNGSTCDILARMADILVSDYGLIVVASVGNEGDTAYVGEPASGKYTIAVGAVCDPSAGGWCYKNDGTGKSSNIGPVTYTDIPGDIDWYKPDVMAPGKNIMCPTINDGITGYDETSGTSPSAAFVSGLVALYLDYDSDLANDTDNDGNPDVKQLLWASAIETPDDSEDGIDVYFGAGRVDGLAGLDFYTSDISSDKNDARNVNANYNADDEPMWRMDPDDYEDWYHLCMEADSTITVTVVCDADLMVEVIIYKGTTQESRDYSVSRGDDCYISYSGTASDNYYLMIRLIGDYGTMGYPGDYYDITINIDSG